MPGCGDATVIDPQTFELPTLSDGVVVVRPYRPHDAAAVAELCADPETQRWWPLPRPYTPAHAERWCGDGERRWHEDAWATFAVADARSDALLGGCDVRVDRERESGDIGYMVGPRGAPSRRRDRERASARTVELRHARPRPPADPRRRTQHDVSHRVMERAGFTREGVLRSYDLINGERVDCVFFSLLPDEWRDRRDASP